MYVKKQAFFNRLFWVPLLLFSSLVMAQTSQHEQAQNALETLVVSASKIRTPVSSVTTNISLLSQEDIALIAPIHINESLKRLAGVWISRGNGQEHLTAIRSPVLSGAGSCGEFFMAEEGISLRAPGFCNANQLFDVNSEQAARIEVLRGPHSSLFGANALHGVVNVLTPEVFDLAPLHWQIEAAGHGYWRGRFVLSEANDQQGVALYGHTTKDEGYKQDSGFDQQKFNVLHQFVGESVSVKNHLSFTQLNQETAGFVEGFKAYENNALKRQNPNPEAYRNSQSIRAFSQWQVTLDEARRIQVTPYFRYNQMNFLMHFVPWQPVEENGHRSVGLQSQYQYSTDTVQLAFGADADWSEAWLTETQRDPFSAILPAGVHYDYEVDALNYSTYMNLNWLALSRLKLELGWRFDVMEYGYNTLVPAGSACDISVVNCRFTRPDAQENRFSDLSYKVGLNYTFAKQQHVYLQYAAGFRPPQAAELYRLQSGQRLTDLDSEALRGYEAGIRGQVDSWFYDLTWFDMDKSNFIFQDTQRRNVDQGETHHQGIELSAEWRLQQWYFGAAATFAQHQYRNNIQISQQNIQGNDIDTAPDTIANMRIGWRDNGHFVELEWAKMGKYFLDPENTATYDGHELVNLRTGWQLDTHWQIALRLLNLLDEDYAERADFTFGNYRYFVGEPRSIYFSVRYSH